MSAAPAEVDRWVDDGGPVPAEPLPPLRLTIDVDTTRFFAAMTGFQTAIRAASEAMARMAHAAGPDWYLDAILATYLAYERPVDRARRLRVDRQGRILARRADRRARIAARNRS